MRITSEEARAHDQAIMDMANLTHALMLLRTRDYWDKNWARINTDKAIASLKALRPMLQDDKEGN